MAMKIAAMARHVVLVLTWQPATTEQKLASVEEDKE
jgi:hypothetical protein